MADGKNIEIKIAATGGDQAAAEVRKPAEAVKVQTEAVKELTAAEKDYQERKAEFEARRASGAFDKNSSGSGEAGGMGGMLDQVPQKAKAAAEAIREVEVETKKLVETVDEVDTKTDKLDENVEKITRMQKAQVIAQLGGQVSQLGNAFNAVADGIESFDKEGAKSLRSIGDNMQAAGSAVSSMAIGFAVGGPRGAGMAALGEGIKYVATEMGKAAEEAVKMEAKYATAFDRLIDKMGTVAGEKAKLELKTWLATLDDEEAAINRQNDALERNRELIEAKATAQAKLDAAKTKNEIATVDADPNLSDAEKIRKKAEITEKAEKKKVEDAVNAQGRDVVAADQDAAAKDDEAKRLAADAEAIKKRKEAEDAERKKLEGKQKVKDAAKAAIPAAEAAQAALETQTSIVLANPLRSDASKRAVEAETEAKRKALEDLKNKAYANPNKENERLKELQANKGTLESEAAKTAEAAKAAREAADKAKLDAEAKRRTLEETLPTTIQTYNEERGARATSSNAAANAAEARAKEKADREKEREAAKAAQKTKKVDAAGRDLETDITGIGKDAAEATRGIGAKGINPEGFNTLAAKIAKKGNPEQDKVDLSSFLSKISLLVDNIPDSKSGSIEAQTLRDVERKLEKKIETLQQQIKNK